MINRRPRPTRAWHRQGFTLVELMIVVAIIGILAATATAAYSEYVVDARVGEATTMMQQIAAKQEEFRANYGSYRTCNNYNPATLPSGNKLRWEADDCWQALGVGSTNPLAWQFITIADDASGGDAITGERAVDTTLPWFYVEARGDIDANPGTQAMQIIIDSQNAVPTIKNRGQ